MASGNSLVIFTPQANVPPTSNYATLDTRNNHLVLDFDASTQEYANFHGVLPRNYAGTTGITVVICWSATSATSGAVVWSAAIERHSSDNIDLDSDSFATAVAASAATTASVSGEVVYTSIAMTDGAQIDNLAVSESFRLQISRVAADGSDNMTGDAELWSVEIVET